MVLKIRFLQLAQRIGRLSDYIGDIRRSLAPAIRSLAKIQWRKWFRWLGRMIAFLLTVTGVVTAASSATSAGTGVALSAAGATGAYVTTKRPNRKYEKIKHVPPANGQRLPVAAHMNYHPATLTKRAGASRPASQKRM